MGGVHLGFRAWRGLWLSLAQEVRGSAVGMKAMLKNGRSPMRTGSRRYLTARWYMQAIGKFYTLYGAFDKCWGYTSDSSEGINES